MNTHDKYELPPLPYSELGGVQPDSHVSRAIENWGCAAIEVDRKTTERQLAAYRRLVNSLESRLTDIQAQHDELKKSTNPDLLASERAANAILTAELEADRKQKGVVVVTRTQDGEIVAVTRQDDEGRILSVIAEADSKRRGEPHPAPTKNQIGDAMCKVSMPFFPGKTRDESHWIIQQFVKELWKIIPPQPAESVKIDPAGYTLGPVSDGGMDPRNTPCSHCTPVDGKYGPRVQKAWHAGWDAAQEAQKTL